MYIQGPWRVDLEWIPEGSIPKTFLERCACPKSPRIPELPVSALLSGIWARVSVSPTAVASAQPLMLG